VRSHAELVRAVDLPALVRGRDDLGAADDVAPLRPPASIAGAPAPSLAAAVGP
jgi:hypothetical protein